MSLSNFIFLKCNHALQLVLGAVIFAAPLIILVKVFYNACLHPLKKYPGPLLAATTPFPFIYYRITGQQVNWIHSLHCQYGEEVRIRPNELSFINPDAWKDIYGYRVGGKGYFEKDPTLLGTDSFVRPGEPAGILRAATIEEHAKQRRLIAHAFSDRAIKQQEHLLRQYTDLLINRIREIATKSPTSKINIMDWYNFTTFDIMADLTFGDSMQQLEKGEYSDWVRGVFGSFKIAAFQQIVRQTPGLQLLMNLITPKVVVDKRKMHMARSIEKTDKRLAKGETERPDFFTHILKYNDSTEEHEKSLNLSQMHSNAATFMIAGTETAASLLGGLTYQLLKNPDIMQKLLSEIRDSFQHEREMNMQNLAQLEYLNWTIEEGLRIYPPVPTGRPRVTPCPGAIVCGNVVPAGTVVSIPHHAAYHSSLNFNNADAFIPERWMSDSIAFAEDKKHTLQPFSFGPRNCVGKNLAYHEVRLILCHVLWNFDLKLCPESDNWMWRQKSFIVWEKGPLMVQLEVVKR